MKPNRILAAAALALAASAFAQSSADHASHHGPAPTTDGEVRKVDKGQGKLTLKHGPIANLDMPGMTMAFRVADPKLLDTVQPGDKVRFTAEKRSGALTVTAIEIAK